MTDLTPRQYEILAFIERFTEGHGFPPSLRDIGAAFGITSTNGVSEHLDALEARGAIARTPGIARGIRVTRRGT